MHPAFEVSIAREHRARNHVAGFHRLRYFRLQRPGVPDAIVYGNVTGEEGLYLGHGDVEYASAPHGAAVDDAQAQGRKRQGLLVETVALRVIKRLTPAQRSEPVAHSELLEELGRRGELATFSMQRAEGARCRCRQTREPVVPLEQ